MLLSIVVSLKRAMKQFMAFIYWYIVEHGDTMALTALYLLVHNFI